MIPQMRCVQRHSSIQNVHNHMLSLTQKRFRRYKLMRGHLPWNRWTPQSFRAAVYKYVNEDEYKNLRNPTGLTQSADNDTIANDNLFNTALPTPTTSFRKIQNVQQNLYKKEFSPSYKEAYHYNSPNPNRRKYDFPETETTNPQAFQSDLWTKYAFKTFIIDRSKFGNLPMYYDYAAHRHTYFTEIKNIKGSKEVRFIVLKFQEIHAIITLFVIGFCPLFACVFG